MFNTGKKDNPKPPGAPRVSPAARSAVISNNFEDIDSSTLRNSDLKVQLNEFFGLNKL